MKVDVSDLSPIKKKMSIEVPPDVIERETKEVLRGYARKANIPGFRPGKAPLSVVGARFAKEVAEDARDRVVARSCREAAREHGLRPIADPVLDELKHEPGEPLCFQTTFEVMPEIELANYKGIEVRRPATAVEDEQVEKSLEQLRQSNVKLIAEEGRAAATGDVIVTDFLATAPDSAPLERERMMIEVGATEHLPAFTEQILGATPGTELEFSVDYPEEHPAKEWAGKAVAHKLTVHEVKRRELPELDDEFAKDLGDFDTLDALRARVREDLEARQKQEAENQVRQSVLDKVLIENPILLPDTLVERETRQRLEDMARNMIMQGMDLEKVDIDWAEMRKRQEEPARKSVHARLILDAIARAESIEVTDKEVDDRVRHDAQRMGRSYSEVIHEVRKGGGLEMLKNQLLREKSLDLLTSVANIQNEE